jgi:hypothetical protein
MYARAQLAILSTRLEQPNLYPFAGRWPKVLRKIDCLQ